MKKKPFTLIEVVMALMILVMMMGFVTKGIRSALLKAKGIKIELERQQIEHILNGALLEGYDPSDVVHNWETFMDSPSEKSASFHIELDEKGWIHVQKI